MSNEIVKEEKEFGQMSFIEKIRATGPSWLAAGLNIGGATIANSVLLAAATGYAFGWVFIIADIAIFFATYACVKLTIITNKNPLNLIKEQMGSTFGWMVGIAILIVNSVFFTIQIALLGDVIHTLMPALSNSAGGVIAIIAGALFLILPGRSANNFIQKAMQILVYVLSLSYIICLFVVDIDWGGLFRGLMSFNLPTSKEAVLLFTSVLGSELALNVPAIQAYASKSDGYTVKRLPLFNFETILGNVFLFIVQISVLIVVSSTLYTRGINPTGAIDAALALEPIAGKFSTLLFCIGVLGATFATMIAETSVQGYVITDLMNWQTEPGSNKFKLIQLIMLAVGLSIPLFGWNPYSVSSWGAAFNSIFMPVGIIGWMILINRESLVGKYKASKKLNIALVITLIVSIVAAVRFLYVTLL